METARRKGIAAADGAIAKITKVVALLGVQPEMGVPGARSGRAMRRFLAGDYWIYYETGAGGVRIRKIRHVRQDQTKDWDATRG